MRRTRARRLAAFTGALFLLVHAASANHATCSVTLSSYAANAYADVTLTFDMGADEPATQEIQWPTGWLFAHQVSSPATPISPIPNDEEQVGNGTLSARWIHTFCSQANVNFTITWESDMTGAPANAVAHLTMTSLGIFNTDIWIIRNAANDYDMEIPTMPTSAVCSSTTSNQATYTFLGQLPSGRRFMQNPSTPGTYTWCFGYTDTNGVTHSGACCSVTIV